MAVGLPKVVILGIIMHVSVDLVWRCRKLQTAFDALEIILNGWNSKLMLMFPSNFLYEWEKKDPSEYRQRTGNEEKSVFRAFHSYSPAFQGRNESLPPLFRWSRSEYVRVDFDRFVPASLRPRTLSQLGPGALPKSGIPGIVSRPCRDLRRCDSASPALSYFQVYLKPFTRHLPGMVYPFFQSFWVKDRKDFGILRLFEIWEWKLELTTAGNFGWRFCSLKVPSRRGTSLSHQDIGDYSP